jgi:hypothetical protein
VYHISIIGSRETHDFTFLLNQSLMGEPGVGKTAIAEGIAQILAAPSMLERLDELFDRNENGEFVKAKEVARIQDLAKLCPARLRNHRIISLELANLVAGTKYRGKVLDHLNDLSHQTCYIHECQFFLQCAQQTPLQRRVRREITSHC